MLDACLLQQVLRGDTHRLPQFSLQTTTTGSGSGSHITDARLTIGNVLLHKLHDALEHGIQVSGEGRRRRGGERYALQVEILLQRLALLEEAKTLPFGAVFDYFNYKNGVPVGEAFIASIEQYEKEVTSKR